MNHTLSFEPATPYADGLSYGCWTVMLPGLSLYTAARALKPLQRRLRGIWDDTLLLASLPSLNTGSVGSVGNGGYGKVHRMPERWGVLTEPRPRQTDSSKFHSRNAFRMSAAALRYKTELRLCIYR